MDKATTSLLANLQKYIIVAIHDILLDIRSVFFNSDYGGVLTGTPHGMFRIFIWETGNRLLFW